MTDRVRTGPAGLRSIRGHTEVVERLLRALGRGRLAHALLFSGPNGVGKATAAWALAQALACPEDPAGGCGTCPVCDRIAREVHPDLIFVRAETQQIKIDQVRRLEEHLARGPSEAPALVAVIDEAERLNLAAANALLKNLEEPRPGVHLVLVTAAPHRLPITVRSRCQRFRFGPLEDADLRAILADLGVAQDALGEAVRFADGSVARGLQLAEETDFGVWQGWCERLTDPETLRRESVPAVAGTLLREVDSPEAVFTLLLPRLRDALLLAAGLDDAGRRLRTLDPASAEARRARETSPRTLLGKMEAVMTALRDLEARINKHLVVEQVLLKLRQ